MGTATQVGAAVAVPGVRGVPLVALAKDPFGFCMRAAREGDGLVRLGAGPVRAYLVSHPDYVRHILVGNAANYVKGSIMDGIRLALGNGLFTSDGDFWRRQRRLMQPAFHTRQIQRMAETVAETVRASMASWAPAVANGTPVDMLRESIRMNITIILETLFGTTVDEERSARLLDLTDQVFAGMTRRVWTFFVPSWLPTPGAAAYRRSIEALDQEIHALIAARRAALADGDAWEDLLSALIQAEDPETGERMSDRQLRDEIFTMFLAGYESTAGGVTWAWHLLSQHPEAAARLREEVDRVLGGRPPAYEDLPALTYTRRVVDETFRLYPAFPMYFRGSVEDDVVGPYAIPGGANIIISPYATHHDPRHWDDPETFDPDRFAPERYDSRAREAYYPFGKGQRMCIGEPMSLTIAQLLIATIAQAYDVRTAPGVQVTGRYAMTYQPKNGLPVILTRR
ncbi:cytochrome P450 [Actinoallomurus purpureus]|uniref:cytochrome P450 n=1 Tax=Actinoallomurus purpureus TaxID=478114 RepID=UPI0020925BA5|nr:cytochrome P450 [Actinoallomurus purpureus]MCO6007619.1 cytochrome P450 [Actinoallomurus purpureus]